jgi:hypothetical protein
LCCNAVKEEFSPPNLQLSLHAFAPRPLLRKLALDSLRERRYTVFPMQAAAAAQYCKPLILRLNPAMQLHRHLR